LRWTSLAVKRVASVVMGQSPPSETYNDVGQGLPFLQGNAEFGAEHPTPRMWCESPAKRCEPRDLLVSVRAPVGAKNIADTSYGIGRGLCAIRAETVSPRYLWYAADVLIEELQARAQGSTYEAVSAVDVGASRIPVPPDHVQEVIANFLDRETARIDETMRRKAAIQALINERTRAWVAVAVCQGVRAAPLRDSGIQGIGACPEHWRATRLRHLPCEVQTGPFGSQLHAGDYVSGGVPIVNPANLIDGLIVPDYAVTATEDIALRLKRHILRHGDVVFGRRGQLGRAALVSDIEDGWLCGTGCLRVRFRTQAFEPSYLREFLRLPAIRQYFESVAIGSTMQNLNSEVLLAMPLLVPSREEQVEIARAVQSYRVRSSALLAKLSRQEELLTEHRQALITAAVTGEIKVTAAVA
jgi:type I restriction enzyme S subunit